MDSFDVDPIKYMVLWTHIRSGYFSGFRTWGVNQPLGGHVPFPPFDSQLGGGPKTGVLGV